MGAVEDVIKELGEANRLFPAFHGAHEGYAVLLEELDELWDEIKRKDRNLQNMRKEAVQVAAMAIRFIEDVCDS